MFTNFSNPDEAQQKAQLYGVDLYFSTRKNKKYMVLAPTGKWVHFGQLGYEDFTKHHDLGRRDAYLRRATKIKGDWKRDKFSPNNLAIHILW